MADKQRSQVFLCTEYYGEPICFNTEMENARFEDVESLLDMNLFLPFKLSLEEFLRQLNEIRLTLDESQSNIETDGGPGSGRYPKGSGKKNEKSGSKKKKSQSLPMTAKEKAKVTHDINNVYHAKYKGKSSCYIRTHSNEPDTDGDEAGKFTTSADSATKVEVNAIFLGETDNGIANAEFRPGAVVKAAEK